MYKWKTCDTIEYMKKKKRIRSSLLKPNKRIRIESHSTPMNVTNKIRVQGGLVGNLLSQIRAFKTAQRNYFK